MFWLVYRHTCICITHTYTDAHRYLHTYAYVCMLMLVHICVHTRILFGSGRASEKTSQVVMYMPCGDVFIFSSVVQVLWSPQAFHPFPLHASGIHSYPRPALLVLCGSSSLSLSAGLVPLHGISRQPLGRDWARTSWCPAVSFQTLPRTYPQSFLLQLKYVVFGCAEVGSASEWRELGI